MLNIKQIRTKPLINPTPLFNNFYNKHLLKNITFEPGSKRIDVYIN